MNFKMQMEGPFPTVSCQAITAQAQFFIDNSFKISLVHAVMILVVNAECLGKQ
jgi:hypothetical protein